MTERFQNADETSSRILTYAGPTPFRPLFFFNLCGTDPFSTPFCSTEDQWVVLNQPSEEPDSAAEAPRRDASCIFG